MSTTRFAAHEAVIIEEGHTIIPPSAADVIKIPGEPPALHQVDKRGSGSSRPGNVKRDSVTGSGKRDSLDLSHSILRYLSFSHHPGKDGDITEPNSPLDFSCRTVGDELDAMQDAEEDDLEMSIQGVLYAPAPNVGRFKVTQAVPKPGQEHLHLPQGPPKVIVVLFGWLNCQDKHLFKYSQLYHKIGVKVVLRHTVPTIQIMEPFQRGVIRSVAEMLKKVPLQYPKSKIVVHYFSNGGCFCHWRLLQLLKTGKFDFPQLAATIFDSAPATATALTGARAMSASSKNVFTKMIIYSGVRFGLEAWGFMNLWTFEKRYIRHIEEDSLTAPSLYIYSESDHITDAAVVEKVVDTRRLYLQSKGIAPESIETWKLEESAHVCHYPNFPEEYRSRIYDFLSKLDML